MRNANEQEARQFLAAVQRRDAKSVAYLVYDQELGVLWRDVLGGLTGDDLEFVSTVLAERAAHME